VPPENKKPGMEELFDGVMGWLNSDDGGEGGLKKCEQCGFTAAHIYIRCPCGFKIDACAYCASRQRETLKEPFVSHADTCKEGSYLVKLMGF